MTKKPRLNLFRIVLSSLKTVLEVIHDAFIGQEFDEKFLYAPGNREKKFYQKRLILGVFTSFWLFVSLTFLSVAPFVIFIASSLPFFFLYYLNIIALKGRLRKQCTALTRVLPLLRLIIKFILKVAGNEHDIQKIFVHSLQYISLEELNPQFNTLVKKMVLGEPVEKILSEFESPSRELDDFIHACRDVNSFPYLASDFETFSQYKTFLKTLESRMVIIVAEAIFLPILASFIFVFQCTDVGVHVVFAIVHLLILKYFARFLINKDYTLLYFVGLFFDRSSQVLDDFITFLMVLGRNIRGHSPEKALMLSLACTSREFLQLLVINNWAYFWIDNFYDKMLALSNDAKSGIIGLIFGLISKFRDYASVDLAQFIIDIAVELKRQKEIEEEKINIIKAERFKVKILVFCLTLILSSFSILFPLLFRGMNSRFFNPFSVFSGNDSLYVFIFVIFNLFYNYTSCFYLIKITGIPSVHKYAIMAVLLFVAIYLPGISFFNVML
ncbi:MAG: hypothetical protein Q6373_022900 [Candidatus Sigynarchaeota archaeon]